MVLTLVGCNLPGGGTNKRLWRIEQNGFGKFAYCQTGIDCPERTQKTIAAYNRQPTSTRPVPDNQSSRVVAQVYFGFAKSGLSPVAVRTLQKTLPQLKGQQRILLRGWTDPVSGKNSPVNQKLARQRAQNVKNWLVKKGVKASVIRLESQPPCCNNQNATAKSAETVRAGMRIVTIELTH